jgi:hypothetical protein
LRSAKLGKRSKFAPIEGCRYDGLYKVVKYWPEKGRSGHLVKILLISVLAKQFSDKFLSLHYGQNLTQQLQAQITATGIIL